MAYADFTVIVTDPCLAAIPSANEFVNMKTSVLVQESDGTPHYETQTLLSVSDSISTARGSQVCGAYTYAISSVPTAPATTLSTLQLFLDLTGPVLIKVYTDQPSKIGTHTATVTLGLVNYC